MGIKVLRPGLLTSMQDLGRYGYQRYGIIVSGGMDLYSLQIANLLVGNEEDEAALEITLMGPSLLIEKDILLAITGGDLSPTVNGASVPMWRPVYVKQGSILNFGACKAGCRAYLAVAGGYDVPEVMGSKSTYLRAGIGGVQGRALQKGDVLPIKAPRQQSADFITKLAKQTSARPFATTAWYAGKMHIPADTQTRKVRVMRGDQFDKFTPDSKQKFFDQVFQITPQSDRMGYRLAGATLQLAEPLEMISEPIVLGTVQVPADGNPIILVADRHPMGGYPKIAQVAVVDMPVVAQLRPGGKIQFEEISLAEAENLYLEREQGLQIIKAAIHLKMK